MSIRKANSIYRSLSAEQKKLVDDKQLSATLSVRDWTAFLRKAAVFDELGEKAVRQYLIYMIILIVFTIIALIVMVDFWQAGLPGTVICAGLLIIVVRNYRRFKKRDLTNHLRLFLLPLLFVLKDKAGDKARVSLKLDLRNPVKTDPVKTFKQDNRRIKLYEPVYVMGKVKLLDEAVLEFLLNDEISALRITKRSSSGKTKIKFKNKVARHYFVKLSFPKKYYKTRNGAGASVRLSETDDFYICKVKVKTKTDKVKEVILLEDFLKTINELYELIQARPDSKFPEEVTKKGPVRESEDEEMEEFENEVDGMGVVVPYMVWHHSYFTDYDYDSFSSEGQYNWDDSEGADSFYDS
jgi:hypothetical protein